MHDLRLTSLPDRHWGFCLTGIYFKGGRYICDSQLTFTKSDFSVKETYSESGTLNDMIHGSDT